MTDAAAIAIIPARGGSKGLPRKNVLPLAGKPLIVHAIEAALSAARIARTVVSTDDAEIAAIARQSGAEVVERPAAIAGDLASSESALLHVLDTLYPGGAAAPPIVAFLQCTSPLTASADIDGLIDALVREGADSAFTGVRFHHFLWRADADGDFQGVNHDRAVRQMRQQRDPEFLETGAAYAMRTEGFRRHGHRFFGRVAMHETPPERVGEIDTREEFAVMEARIAALRSQADSDRLPARPSALILDFDGVLTDDRVTVSEQGRESVVCSRRDGMGIELLRKAGLAMIVLSKEANPVVLARCAKLQLACEHGLPDKLPILRRWAAAAAIDLSAAIYIGNDINDLDCFRAVGCAVAPRDAHPAALAAADVILDADGGKGAVRMLADLILPRLSAPVHPPVPPT